MKKSRSKKEEKKPILQFTYNYLCINKDYAERKFHALQIIEKQARKSF